MTGGRFVKFCGITRAEDAAEAVRLGVDALGFDFWPGGPRAIDPGHVRPIIETLPPQVRRVGVFVDEPPSRILEVVAAAGLDAVQLHGDEPPEWCAALARVEEEVAAMQAIADAEGAGIRIEPPWSPPSVRSTMSVAMAIAEPLEEPPGWRSGSRGLRAGP